MYAGNWSNAALGADHGLIAATEGTDSDLTEKAWCFHYMPSTSLAVPYRRRTGGDSGAGE